MLVTHGIFFVRFLGENCFPARPKLESCFFNDSPDAGQEAAGENTALEWHKNSSCRGIIWQVARAQNRD